MTSLRIENDNTGITFSVKIVPGSSKTQICGLYEDMLKIKVSAPPEKGKANKELIGFLSKSLGVRKNQISITAGMTNPVKTIHVTRFTAGELADILNLDQQESQ